jgi:hypothetical protein
MYMYLTFNLIFFIIGHQTFEYEFRSHISNHPTRTLHIVYSVLIGFFLQYE